jgi:hypothetical protein
VLGTCMAVIWLSAWRIFRSTLNDFDAATNFSGFPGDAPIKTRDVFDRRQAADLGRCVTGSEIARVQIRPWSRWRRTWSSCAFSEMPIDCAVR